MNREIKEITNIINKRCEAELGQIHTTSQDGKVTKTVDTSLIARDVIDAGYKKESDVATQIFCRLLALCYDDDHPRGSIAAGEIKYIAKFEYGIEL